MESLRPIIASNLVSLGFFDFGMLASLAGRFDKELTLKSDQRQVDKRVEKSQVRELCDGQLSNIFFLGE
jgi:hypothetical protein